MRALVERFVARPQRAANLSVWIRALLVEHIRSAAPSSSLSPSRSCALKSLTELKAKWGRILERSERGGVENDHEISIQSRRGEL